MGCRLARSAAQVRVELDRCNAWMFWRSGFFHVREGGGWDGEENSPEGLAISTFPHFLWTWLVSGSEQRLANVAHTRLWHAVASQNHL